MPTKTRSTDKDLRVREIEELSRVLLEEHLSALDEGPNVSWAQLRALSVLSRRGALNLSALARWTQASLPSASRLVDRLEAGDLVERATHPTSRREIEIRLTAAGRGVLNDVRTARRKRLRKTLVGMEPTQVSALLEGLEAFARSRDAAEA
ncbi:MarR family winged helix-turn-helix transcriptional regulator [Angustibacter aerolatus]